MAEYLVATSDASLTSPTWRVCSFKKAFISVAVAFSYISYFLTSNNLYSPPFTGNINDSTSARESIDNRLIFMSDESTNQSLTNQSNVLMGATNRSSEPKLILAWTPFFDSPFTKEWFRWCSATAEFAIHPCEIKTDQKLSAQAEAILFHMRDFSWKNIPNEIERTPSQRYVFILWESPIHSYIDLRVSVARRFFNWTLTYRRDSDIYDPYGRFEPLTDGFFNWSRIDQKILGKRKTAAQFVSNCVTSSRREDIVNVLRESIDVDVFGRCGAPSCSRGKNTECLEMLENDYKFYLAFENSVCVDYVTEKFFEKIAMNVVPVVLYGANYRSIAPKDSYIALDDFRSVKALGDYLRYLASNLTAYREYFSWREKFRVGELGFNGLCELCRRLWIGSTPVSVVEDIHDWWTTKGRCESNFGEKFPKV